jgi:hypothetical protein
LCGCVGECVWAAVLTARNATTAAALKRCVCVCVCMYIYS